MFFQRITGIESMSEQDKKYTFKYNMSFYYQSTIVYFVVFIIYAIIRGEFFEGSFILITRDPIIYFFAIIVLVSLASLLYNLFKNRHVEISADGIAFIDRSKTKSFNKEIISSIKISRRRVSSKKKVFRLISIKLKNRRRRILIRPYDYENENEFISKLQELKSEIEKDNV
jgi:hypothetical protein